MSFSSMKYSLRCWIEENWKAMICYPLSFILGIPIFFIMICLFLASASPEAYVGSHQLGDYGYLGLLADLTKSFGWISTKGVVLLCTIYEICFLIWFLLFVSDVKDFSIKKSVFWGLHISPLVVLLPVFVLIKGMADAYAQTIFVGFDGDIVGGRIDDKALLGSLIQVSTTVLPIVFLAAYDTVTFLFIAFSGKSKDDIIKELEQVKQDLEQEKIKSNLYQSFFEESDRTVQKKVKGTRSSDLFRFVLDKPLVNVIGIDRSDALYQYFESLFVLEQDNRTFSYLKFLVTVDSIFEKSLPQKNDEWYIPWRNVDSVLNATNPLVVTNKFFSLPQNAVSVDRKYSAYLEKCECVDSTSYMWSREVHENEFWGWLCYLDWEHKYRIVFFGNKKSPSDIFVIPCDELKGYLSNIIFLVHREENGEIFVLRFYDYNHCKFYAKRYLKYAFDMEFEREMLSQQREIKKKQKKLERALLQHRKQ